MESLCSVVHDQSLINEDMIYGYSEPFYDDKIFRALTRMIREREGDLSSQDLKTIEIPCLLVWGKKIKSFQSKSDTSFRKICPSLVLSPSNKQAI